MSEALIASSVKDLETRVNGAAEPEQGSSNDLAASSVGDDRLNPRLAPF